MPYAPSSAFSSSFYQTVYDTYISPNNPYAAACETSKEEYNRNFRNTRTSLDELRKSTCLSDEVKYGEEIEASSNQKNDLVARYTAQKEMFDSYLDSVKVLQNARGPFDTYLQELEDQKAALVAENYEIQQRMRAGRRRFMDAAPQGGVKSVLGLQTADDKVLLAFWICFSLGIAAIALVFLIKYGESLNLMTTQQKIVVFLVILGFCMGVAFYFIRNYG